MKEIQIFDDHLLSYFYWKENNLKDQTIIHIDTHIDATDEWLKEETLEKISTCNLDQFIEFQSRMVGLGEGLNCGNYLYQAIWEDIVGRFIWVVPDIKDNEFESWVRGQLKSNIDFSFSDYQTFKLKDNILKGRLLGRDFWICRLADLPAFEEEVILDIDLDYFITPVQDQIWMNVLNFVNVLQEKKLNWSRVYVAYSLAGGYTSVQFKYLGDLLYRLLKNDNQTEPYKELLQADLLKQEGCLEQAEKMYLQLCEKHPDFASAFYSLSLVTSDPEKKNYYEEKALTLDENLKIKEIDKGFALLRQEKFSPALEIFEECHAKKHDVETLAILAYAYFKAKEVKKAKEEFEKTFFFQLQKREKAYLHNFLGQIYFDENNFWQAVFHFNEAVAIFPDDYVYLANLGKALCEGGKVDQAIIYLRKALKLHPDRLNHFKTYHFLAKCYWQKGLKSMTEKYINQSKEFDLDHEFTYKNILLNLKK